MTFRSTRATGVARIAMGAAMAWMTSAGCSDHPVSDTDASADALTTSDVTRPANDASATMDTAVNADAVTVMDTIATADARGPDVLSDVTSVDGTISVDVDPDPQCSCKVIDSGVPPPLHKGGLLTLPCYCARNWSELGDAPPACLSFDESIDCQGDYGHRAAIETFKNCAFVAIHFDSLGPDVRFFQSQTHELVGAHRGTDHTLQCSTSEVITIRAGVLPAAECEREAILNPCLDAGPRPDAKDASRDSDASPDGDAPPDADTLSQCRQLQADWSTFVQQHRSCTDTTQCVTVGGAQACDCGGGSTDLGLGRPIGNASGDAISTTAATEAQVYLDRFRELRCNYLRDLCVFDAAPGRNLRCESGQCTLTNWSCLSDAGFAPGAR